MQVANLWIDIHQVEAISFEKGNTQNMYVEPSRSSRIPGEDFQNHQNNQNVEYWIIYMKSGKSFPVCTSKETKTLFVNQFVSQINSAPTYSSSTLSHVSNVSNQNQTLYSTTIPNQRIENQRNEHQKNEHQRNENQRNEPRYENQSYEPPKQPTYYIERQTEWIDPRESREYEQAIQSTYENHYYPTDQNDLEQEYLAQLYQDENDFTPFSQPSSQPQPKVIIQKQQPQQPLQSQSKIQQSQVPQQQIPQQQKRVDNTPVQPIQSTRPAQPPKVTIQRKSAPVQSAPPVQLRTVKSIDAHIKNSEQAGSIVNFDHAIEYTEAEMKAMAKAQKKNGM